MLNLFKKTKKNEVNITEPNSKSVKEVIENSSIVLNTKTVNETIEEIHETFYTEVDKLLAFAKIEKSLDTDKQDLIVKCNKLKALGFVNSKEVKEAEKEIERLNEIKKYNETKKDLLNAIEYFSFKYPNYKFITEESVKKICKKYNLCYGSVNNYIGDVPDKNLKHIEDFKIDVLDLCFEVHDRLYDIIYMSYNVYEKFILDNFNDFFHTFKKNIEKYSSYLEIVAPPKDFDMKGKQVKEYKISEIEYPDPIVLKPVIFNEKKHYLIVTAWGIEAGDELVVNPRDN